MSDDLYQQGDRIELVATSDPVTRLRPGDQGTVLRHRRTLDGDVVSVRWDTGSSLSMLLDEGDQIRRLTPSLPSSQEVEDGS